MEGLEDAHASIKIGWTEAYSSKLSLSVHHTLRLVESRIAFDPRLPIGGLQSVTVWHCVALLVVAYLCHVNERAWPNPTCIA